MISIIIPAYNAEKYIEECVDSIRRQTFEDWEILLIDDGSTDRTPSICDRYVADDSRIHVVHVENGGVSKARNIGLSMASGEYIAFADADDILPSESLKIRIDLIGKADLAVAGYELFSSEGIIEKTPSCRQGMWDQHEMVNNIAVTGEMGYQGFLWNKLFRREIINNNRLDFVIGLPFNEDRVFCTEYSLCCTKANYSSKLSYRYRITHDNTTSSVYGMKDKDLDRFRLEFRAFDRILKMVKDRYEDSYYLTAVEAQYRAVMLKREILKSERSLVRETNRQIVRYGTIALRAPRRILPCKKKAAVLTHMALRY